MNDKRDPQFEVMRELIASMTRREEAELWLRADSKGIRVRPRDKRPAVSAQSLLQKYLLGITDSPAERALHQILITSLLWAMFQYVAYQVVEIADVNIGWLVIGVGITSAFALCFYYLLTAVKAFQRIRQDNT